MKPENQNSDITMMDDGIESQNHNHRDKALDILNTQLAGLKREMEHTTEHGPYHDFEKSICTKKTDSTCVSTYVHKKFRYNAIAPKQKIDDIDNIDNIIKYGDPVAVSFLIDYLLDNPFSIIQYDERIINLHDYFVSSLHIPLLYILRGSKRPIITKEWVFAYEERKTLKLLKKVEGLRNANKMPYRALSNGEADTVNLKPIFAKIFAYECMKVYNENTVQINTYTRFIYSKKIHYVSDEPEEIEKFEKNYKLIFPLLYSNKSTMKYAINTPKRNAQHTSHLTTLRKIAPDFLKLNDARSLVDYKNKIKQMAYSSYYRKDVQRDSGRGFYDSHTNTEPKYDHRNR